MLTIQAGYINLLISKTKYLLLIRVYCVMHVWWLTFINISLMYWGFHFQATTKYLYILENDWLIAFIHLHDELIVKIPLNIIISIHIEPTDERMISTSWWEVLVLYATPYWYPFEFTYYEFDIPVNNTENSDLITFGNIVLNVSMNKKLK